MLQLHKASISSDPSPLQREHRKRVWWSTFCLDRLTSTQRGLLPTLTAEQTDLSYPSSHGLGVEEIGDFTDPDFLTARIQLTVIQTGNSEVLSRSTGDEAEVIETVLRPMLQRLVSWKNSLPSHMAFETESDILSSGSSLAFKRSLANPNLRYNQVRCKGLSQTSLHHMRRWSLTLTSVCLSYCDLSFSSRLHTYSPTRRQVLLNPDISISSARSNLRIMIHLRTYSLLSKSNPSLPDLFPSPMTKKIPFIARLGLMENMHLFTSLMVVCLGISTKSRTSGTFCQDTDDVARYKLGKEVLVYMMESGSLAAKGHLNTLKDVEDLAAVIATDTGSETYQREGLQGDVDELMSQFLQGDVDEWMSQFLQIENGSGAYSC